MSEATLEIVDIAAPSVLWEAAQEGVTPDPYAPLDEWADQHRIIPSDACAEHGLWRTSRVPYTREIMQELSPRSDSEIVTFLKSTQVAGSEVVNNLVAYVMAKQLQSMMLSQPTLTVMEEYSKLRIEPMIREMPELQAVMHYGKGHGRKSRDSDDTILLKKYVGGMLKMVGANSAASLRSTPVRFLLCDEVDAYVQDCEGEGSPVALMKKRTDNFANRKIFLCSSPLDELTSIIEPSYLASDQRLYFVPCPFCDHGQHLQWKNLIFRDHPGVSEQEPKYLCEQCKKLIAEFYKTQMLEQGQWIKQKPEVKGHAGFRIHGLYTPVGWKNTWANMVAEHLDAHREKDPVKKRLKRKEFTNTRLAETWKEDVEAPLEIDKLMLRTEPPWKVLPQEIKVITVGLDVQEDRIEFEVVGWGAGRESWSLDYQVFWGNPAVLPTEGVWKQFDIYRTKVWTKADGTQLHISAVGIDTGHHTYPVYKFISPRQQQGIRAVKGANDSGLPLINMAKKPNDWGIMLCRVGTVAAKDYIYGCLRLDEPGPGYAHFQEGRDRNYYKGLLSEKVKRRMSRGLLTRYYDQIVERNEPLDNRVYSLAALIMTGFPLDVPTADVQTPPPKPEKPEKEGGWVRRKKGWMRR